MSHDIYETKDGLKVRKLVDLKANTAKEYQEAMLHRVEKFSKRKDSPFNDFIENTVVQGLKVILDTKVKVDNLLGSNKEKIQNFIEKILLIGL